MATPGGSVSGEFGSYTTGYVDAQLQQAALDCQGGDGEITRLLGDLLMELYPLARQVCLYEAHDSGYYAPVLTAIETLPGIRRAVEGLEKHVGPFAEVAKAAARSAIQRANEEAA